MSASFLSNNKLNEMFPLASCPSGSMDNASESHWFITELSGRLLAAIFIGDRVTQKQLQDRINIHRAIQAHRGIL